MIVTVASGKGGTGKTTIAVSLAWSLKEDMPVQVLDCDVEEPNSHLFLQPALTTRDAVNVPVPVVDKAKCDYCGKCAEVCAFNAIAVINDYVLTFPELCHGCGGCTLFCPTGAISEQPREVGVVEAGQAGEIDFTHGRLNIGAALAPPVIKAVRGKSQAKPAVIIDAPPGASCPVVASVNGADFCLLVTEPTPFGLHDLTLAAGMVRELGVPMGVIINRSGLDDAATERYCRQEGIPVLLKIPFDRRIAACYARGGLLAEEFPEWKQRFKDLWKEIERRSGG